VFVGYVVPESLGSARDGARSSWFLSGVEGLEDIAGAGLAIESHAQSAACAVLNFQPYSPACFSTALEDLAGRTRLQDIVLMLSFQPSSPACFSTALEDLAGTSLVSDSSLEGLARSAS
jgi:hypothetical protein